MVAKGYTQTYRLDYFERFSSIAKLKLVRIIISVAANLICPLFQLNAKNAFSHEALKELYKERPIELGVQEEEKEVFKIKRGKKKSFYRLKKSPSSWFHKSKRVVAKYGLRRSHENNSIS